MNKKELIKKIVSSHAGISIQKAQIIIDILIQNISLALKKGDRVTFRGFGAFYNSERQGKRYYDIQTGAIKISSTKKSVKFVPYKKFKESLLFKVLDTHIENDGSIGNIVKLEKEVFRYPSVRESHMNTKPLYGKENIGYRRVRKSDIETTNLLFEGTFLFDHYSGESEHKNYPSLRIPQKNTPILMPQVDEFGTTIGVMEPVLLEYLYRMCKEINGIKVLENVKIPILNRNYSYRPDFCLYWEEKKLYIDIEIDEPYDIVTRKPIHYQGNSDTLRDRYFIRNGWCVVRFAEQQIKDNAEGVINYLKRMLSWLTGESEINFHEETLNTIDRWSYEEATEMSSDNTREKYLGLPVHMSSDVSSSIEFTDELSPNAFNFQKPDEDILPNLASTQEDCKWASVVEELKQSSSEYCIVKKNNDYQWIYTCKTLNISNIYGIDVISGESPLGIEHNILLDEIVEISPLKELFSEIQWEVNSSSLENYKVLNEILFDAIANGKPIWIAYCSNSSGYGERFLSNIVYAWRTSSFSTPHIGLGHCAKYGILSLSHFYAYCSYRKEFRMFAADGRIKQLKVLNCDHVYLIDDEYANSFASLVMHPYEFNNGNAFFENADEILRIMPQNELESLFVQGNLANLQVMKGEINKAILTYQQKPYKFFLNQSETWGEVCISDIKFFIELCKEHLNDTSFYEGLEADVIKSRFETVLIELTNSSWMQD